MEKVPTLNSEFEGKFKNREYLETSGGKIEVLDLTVENAKSELPVFIAPGFATTIDVYKRGLELLHNEKRRVIAINQPRRGGEKVEIDDGLEDFPPEDVRRAHSILDVLESKGIDKTDMIGHSEGAVNAVIAAHLKPEKFRNVVLVAPAGLIGEDTLPRLSKGFVGQFTKGKPSLNEIPVSDEDKEWAKQRGMKAIEYPKIQMEAPLSQLTTVVSEGAKYAIGNPARTIREGLGLARVDIRALLRELHKKGVGVVIMSGVDDPLFPAEKMAQIAKEDMLDGFLSVRGGHGEIADNPKQIMGAAEQMLTALEQKQKTRSDTSDESQGDTD